MSRVHEDGRPILTVPRAVLRSLLALLLAAPALCACTADAGGGSVVCGSTCECGPPAQVCVAGRCEPGCLDTGCPSGTSCDPDSGHCFQSLTRTCHRDLDCDPPDRICVEGSCAPGCELTCCYGGTRCNAETGYCDPDPVYGCRDDRDCAPPATTCVDGRCLTPRYCLSDADCDPPAKTCQGGICLDGCLAMGCAQGLVCDEDTGRCATGSTPTTCTGDAGCAPPATICEGGACVAGCGTTGCAGAATCDGDTGRCVVGPQGCTSDQGCEPPATVCEAGACVPGCGSTGCPGGQACDGGTGRCRPAVATCTNDTNCTPPTTICEGGSCVPGCLTTPCGGGSTCNVGTGRCEAVQPGCTGDAQCDPPTTVCEAGVCVPGCPTDPCPAGVDCDPTTGRCLHKASLGEPCGSSSECLTGMCIGIQLTSGEQHQLCVMPCCGGNDCPAGFGCMPQPGVRFCIPASVIPGATFQVADGGACQNATQCQSGSCWSTGKCVESCCTTQDCALAGLHTCQLKQADGGSVMRACDLDQAQLWCGYDQCYQPLGGPCTSDFDCQSLMCDNVYPDAGLQCAGFCCRNEQCAVGQACRMYGEVVPGTTPYFAMFCQKEGSIPLGQACYKGSECQAGDCVGNTCRRLCCATADCPQGQTCRLGIKDDPVSGLQSYVTYCD